MKGQQKLAFRLFNRPVFAGFYPNQAFKLSFVLSGKVIYSIKISVGKIDKSLLHETIFRVK
jgi:hypothetical protein